MISVVLSHHSGLHISHRSIEVPVCECECVRMFVLPVRDNRSGDWFMWMIIQWKINCLHAFGLWRKK